LLKVIPVVEEQGNVMEVGQANILLGTLMVKNNQLDLAKKHIESALKSFANIKNKEWLGYVYGEFAGYYWRQRMYSEAMYNIDLAHGSIESFEMPFLRARLYNQQANVFKIYGQYEKALACCHKALVAVEKEENIGVTAYVFLNMGSVYFEIKRVDKALEMYQKSLKLYRSLNDKASVAKCYNNIGDVFLLSGEIQKATENYRYYVGQCKEAKDTVGMIIGYMNIGSALKIGGQYHQAIRHLSIAANFLNDYKDPSLKVEVLMKKAEIYLAIGQYQQAKDYLKQALEIAKLLGEKKHIANCFNTLSSIYEKESDFRTALFYKNEFQAINDSLLNESSIESLARMEAVYKSGEKEQIIERLVTEKKSIRDYLVKEKSQRLILVFAASFLFVFTLVLFLLFRIKHKTGIALRKKNEELKQLNATKDKFFSILAHDLKSPFNTLMGFSEMLSLHAESQRPDEIIEYSKIIHNSTKKLYSLVETLLQWSRTQIGTTEYNPERLALSLVSNNIISLLRMNAEEKDILIVSKINDKIVGWADKNLFSTVLRNLLSNAIKFSRRASVITVSAEIKGKMIELAVEDTGVGISADNKSKLFRIDSNVSTVGTSNEKGTGIGLVLCKEFVEINKGSIRVKSVEGKGSVFLFTIPLCSNDF
ncbi:tetratricopeptide repeat protein, partial [bacterium]|nr:tetratricopeptide repeat protein [bacterium]